MAHRFAGSGDRAAIAGLVYDTLRRKNSAGFLMRSDTPRATILGMLRLERALSSEAIAALFSGEWFAPAPLSADEREALAADLRLDAPSPAAGDYPDWLDPYLARTFGDEQAEEGGCAGPACAAGSAGQYAQGFAREAQAALRHLGATLCRWSPIGPRIELRPDAETQRPRRTRLSRRAR